MPPIALARLSGRYLSFSHRKVIGIVHTQQLGAREITRRIGRSPSTASRKLRRNASTRSHSVTYRATTAQMARTSGVPDVRRGKPTPNAGSETRPKRLIVC